MNIATIFKNLFFDKYKKPRRFENFICKFFKDSGEFDLLKRPNVYFKGLKSEEDNYPDCKFKDKRSDKIFWVECKWRPFWNLKNREETTFFNRGKIDYYKMVQKKNGLKLFVALGIGKDRETRDILKPKELYFFPIDMFSKYYYMRKKYLVENNRQHNFKYKNPKFFPSNNDLK